jgi:hypothetical protein
MPTLTVRITNVYGNRTIYPACDLSRKFADLIGTRTFTPRAVEQIKAMGYTFAVEQTETV